MRMTYSVNALIIKGLDIGPLKIGWIGFISLVGILSMGWFYASVAFSKIKFLQSGFSKLA